MKKKGSALLLTIVIMALLIAVTVSVVSATSSTSKSNVKYDDNYNLKLAAESGIVKGITELRKSQVYSKFAINGTPQTNVNNTSLPSSARDLSFTTADNKYQCDVIIYNYDINDTNVNTKYKKYTITATSSTNESNISKRRKKTVTAITNKIAVSTEREEAFCDEFTDKAISLIPNSVSKGRSTVALDASEGAKNKHHFWITDPGEAYIQGSLGEYKSNGNNRGYQKISTNLEPGDLNVGGTKKLPKIKIENGTPENQWYNFIPSNPNIYAYKANNNEDLSDLYIKATDKGLPNNFLSSDTFKKVILIPGYFNINKGNEFNEDFTIGLSTGNGGGNAFGNVVNVATVNNCIILCTGTIKTDVTRSGVLFQNSSVCAYDSQYVNKMFLGFDHKFNFGTNALEEQEIKNLIVNNTTYSAATGTATNLDYTNEPDSKLTYLD